MDVGVDTCAPVGPYPHRYAFTGTIDHVDVELHDELSPDDMMRYFQGLNRAAEAQQ